MPISTRHGRTMKRAAALLACALLGAGCRILTDAVETVETEDAALARLEALAAESGRKDKADRAKIAAISDDYWQEHPPAEGGAQCPGPPPPEPDPPELVARTRPLREQLRARRSQLTGAYERAIRQHPGSWRLRDAFASCLYEQHADETRALALWLEASELSPDSADIHCNIGVIQGQCGKPVEALARFRRAVELDPGGAVYHFNLATTYFVSRYDIIKAEGGTLPEIYWKSQAAYEKARELDPENYQYAISCAQNYFWAHFFGVENVHAKAVMSWERCIETAQTAQQKAFVYTNLGRVHWKGGDLDVAEGLLLKSLELRPNLATQNLLNRVRQAKQARNDG